MSERHEFKDAFESGIAAECAEAAPKQARPGGVPYILVPAGTEVVKLDGDLLEAPLTRIVASPILKTSASFCRYLQRFIADDPTAGLLFGDKQAHKVQAILDYHSVEGPERCDHRAGAYRRCYRRFELRQSTGTGRAEAVPVDQPPRRPRPDPSIGR